VKREGTLVLFNPPRNSIARSQMGSGTGVTDPPMVHPLRDHSSIGTPCKFDHRWCIHSGREGTSLFNPNDGASGWRSHSKREGTPAFDPRCIHEITQQWEEPWCVLTTTASTLRDHTVWRSCYLIHRASIARSQRKREGTLCCLDPLMDGASIARSQVRGKEPWCYLIQLMAVSQ
jgi:hypothetical protein